MSAAPSPTKPCPCGSERTYAACCRPFHRGESDAPSAEALMRSRYAAFAIGDGAYLARTLHPSHEDRAQASEEVLARQLREVARNLKFMGLRVIEAHEDGDRAQVLFFARVFEKGQDRSFLEKSNFVREGGRWLYLGGTPREHPAKAPLEPGLSLASFTG
jgi:SEC-C motif-containing protein